MLLAVPHPLLLAVPPPLARAGPSSLPGGMAVVALATNWLGVGSKVFPFLDCCVIGVGTSEQRPSGEEERVSGSNGAAAEDAAPPNYPRASGTSPGQADDRAFPGFDDFYERTVERIYAYLRARTSSDEEAADLMQQIYLQALKAWPRRPATPDALVPWLFRIGRNAATDLYRRRRPTVAWEHVPESLHPVEAQRVEDRMLRRESVAHLRRLLDGLPPGKREILALRFAARLSYADIGAIIGKSEAATKQQILRLLYALKERYDER